MAIDAMDQMADGIQDFLFALCRVTGMDANDPNFTDTPNRVARAYEELCGGAYNFEERCNQILDKSFPNEKGYREMVFVDNIQSAGVCPHHLLPVEYIIHIAYIPSPEGKVVGLSKIARIADMCASRPVLQETVTQDILIQLRKLNPEGLGVYVRGRHGCMRVRGVMQPASSTTTTAFDGIFMDNDSTRAEFMGLVNESNRS